jgi:hypothetical protein
VGAAAGAESGPEGWGLVLRDAAPRRHIADGAVQVDGGSPTPPDASALAADMNPSALLLDFGLTAWHVPNGAAGAVSVLLVFGVGR